MKSSRKKDLINNATLVPGEEEPQLDLERHETTRRQSLAAQRWPRQVEFDVKIIINYNQLLSEMASQGKV